MTNLLTIPFILSSSPQTHRMPHCTFTKRNPFPYHATFRPHNDSSYHLHLFWYSIRCDNEDYSTFRSVK